SSLILDDVSPRNSAVQAPVLVSRSPTDKPNGVVCMSIRGTFFFLTIEIDINKKDSSYSGHSLTFSLTQEARLPPLHRSLTASQQPAVVVLTSWRACVDGHGCAQVV